MSKELLDKLKKLASLISEVQDQMSDEADYNDDVCEDYVHLFGNGCNGLAEDLVALNDIIYKNE